MLESILAAVALQIATQFGPVLVASAATAGVTAVKALVKKAGDKIPPKYVPLASAAMGAAAAAIAGQDAAQGAQAGLAAVGANQIFKLWTPGSHAKDQAEGKP